MSSSTISTSNKNMDFTFAEPISFKSSKKSIQINVVIAFFSIVSLTIMVLTKFFPCFKVSWSQDFCDKWNEFWFSLSVSFVAAILFYIIFTIVPKKAKRQEIESLINDEIHSVIIHMLLTLSLIKGKYVNNSTFFIKEQFVKELIELDWQKEYPYLFDDLKQKPFIICLKSEINHIKDRLEKILFRYRNDFTNDEISFFTKEILHNKIISHNYIYGFKNALNQEQKTEIASLLFDFYWKLVNFASLFNYNSDDTFDL